MKDLTYALLLIFFLGVALLIINSCLCISEGFSSNPGYCDVNTPCPGKLKCVNGFCADTKRIPIVEEKEPVDLLQVGSAAPYF
jgi:hypothetical protein